MASTPDPPEASATALRRDPDGLALARLPVATAVALVLFVFVSGGYPGVVHDARLYAVQALARLDPAAFAADLFFAFGSQDRFSMFSVGYAPLVNVLGLTDAALVVTLVSAASLFVATWVLVASCRGRASATAATLAVAIWPVVYGAESVFRVAEPFATPRALAAALGLLAIAAALRNRVAIAMAMVALATLVHPLIALPAAALAAIVILRPLHLVAFAVAGGAALLAAAAIGVPVADRLFIAMDREWIDATLQRSPFLSPLRWGVSDWSLAGVSVLGPLLVAWRIEGPLRRALVGAALLGALGTAVALIGGDLLHSVLVVQVQPWRALWLSHWLGVAGIGLLVARYVGERRSADLVALAGLAGAELAGAGVGVVIIGITFWALRTLDTSTDPRWSRIAALAVMLAALQALAWRVLEMPAAWTFKALDLGTTSFLHPGFTDPLLAAAALVVLALGWRRFPPMLQGVVPWALVATVSVVAVTEIGQTRSREVAAMNGIRDRAAILARLPKGGSILWDHGGFHAWFGLRYPVYISGVQTAGTVFSRATAIEAVRRARHVEGVLGEQLYMRWAVTRGNARPVRVGDLPRLCSDPLLSAVYVPGRNEVPSAIAVHDAQGVLSGWLAFCEGYRS